MIKVSDIVKVYKNGNMELEVLKKLKERFPKYRE